MSALTISLPESLRKRIEDAATRDGISLEQFVASAAAEKLAAWMTMDYLKREAALGRREDFDSFLSAVPANPPLPGDEMPEA